MYGLRRSAQDDDTSRVSSYGEREREREREHSRVKIVMIYYYPIVECCGFLYVWGLECGFGRWLVEQGPG